MPTIGYRLLVAVLALTLLAAAGEPPSAVLRRGINITNWFRFPPSRDPAALRAYLSDTALEELKRIGFNVGGVNTPATETPITPIIVGEGRKAMDFSRALFEQGVMATGIAFPTVPEGKARIRLIMTSEHSRAQLEQALDKLERVARPLGILQ